MGVWSWTSCREPCWPRQGMSWGNLDSELIHCDHLWSVSPCGRWDCSLSRFGFFSVHPPWTGLMFDRPSFQVQGAEFQDRQYHAMKPEDHVRPDSCQARSDLGVQQNDGSGSTSNRSRDALNEAHWSEMIKLINQFWWANCEQTSKVS